MSDQSPPPPPDGSGFPPAPGAPPPPGGGAPPPPGSVPPPPPPGTWGQQPPGMTPVGYAPAALATVEGPRPRVKVGGILIVAGAVLSIICCFLPWVTEGDRSINGFDDFILLTDNDISLIESPATFMIVVALIVGGLGVALLAAGRVLAVAIIAIVGAAIFEILGLAMIGFSAGHTDLNGGDVGVGAIMQAVVPLVSLAGAIVATATRRKPVPATSTGMPGPGAPTQF